MSFLASVPTYVVCDIFLCKTILRIINKHINICIVTDQNQLNDKKIDTLDSNLE